MNSLIITTGTRDIQSQKSDIEKALGNKITQQIFINDKAIKARDGGKILFENYNKIKHLLSFPIIKPTIEYLLCENKKIDLVILIATNQNPPHNGDTLYFCKIIQMLLPVKYKNKLPDIRIIEINENVTYLDSMYTFWKQQLGKKPFHLLGDAQAIYLHSMGGIDAINTGLTLNCLARYGKKVKVLYVNEKTQTCAPLEFSKLFLSDSEKRKALALLENYNYEAIAELEDLQDDVRIVAQYASHRLNFDFDNASLALTKLSPSQRNIQETLLTETAKFKVQSNKTKELYWNMLIKFKQKNYVDFLLRFFRLYEELLKNKVLDLYNITGYTQHNWESAFIQVIENDSKLKDFLESKKLDYQSNDPSTTLLLALLEYKQQDEFFSKLQCLTQLRNYSIGAHAFEPVSSFLINEKLKKANIDNIEKVLEVLKTYLNVKDNPYDKLNHDLKNAFFF